MWPLEGGLMGGEHERVRGGRKQRESRVWTRIFYVRPHSMLRFNFFFFLFEKLFFKNGFWSHHIF